MVVPSYASLTPQDAEDINGHQQLSIEATAIHHNFTQQVRGGAP